MHDRRTFLGAAAAIGAGCALPVTQAQASPGVDTAEILDALRASTLTPEKAARDEAFWGLAQRAFLTDRSMINLNNGGVSPTVLPALESVRRHAEFASSAPTSWALWSEQKPRREAVREGFARLFGADAEEVAFTRNASESLMTCQFGFDLRAGDEVLTTTQDYSRMLSAFRQMERRWGVVLRQVRLPVPAEDPAEVVRIFESAITPRTRMILACHVINLTGQILPVREIAALGRARGIPVIIDGAHGVAMLDFRIHDLGCDYYASSLHKWLFAPHGTGLLWVRRERIDGLWPLMAAEPDLNANIRKFEEIGTHPESIYLAIGDAMAFHEALGPKRKLARMYALRERWTAPLLRHDRVRLHTSLKPGVSSPLGCVEIEGVDPAELHRALWERHRIWTVAIVHPEFRGLRVSPSVYTRPEEIDRFVEAMERAVRGGAAAV